MIEGFLEGFAIVCSKMGYWLGAMLAVVLIVLFGIIAGNLLAAIAVVLLKWTNRLVQKGKL